MTAAAIHVVLNRTSFGAISLQATSFPGSLIALPEAVELGSLGPGIVQYLMLQALGQTGDDGSSLQDVTKDSNATGIDAFYDVELKGNYAGPTNLTMVDLVTELGEFEELMIDLKAALEVVGLRVHNVSVQDTTVIRLQLPDELTITATIAPVA